MNIKNIVLLILITALLSTPYLNAAQDNDIDLTGGTYATVVDDRGQELPPNTLGHLVVRKDWPSMAMVV